MKMRDRVKAKLKARREKLGLSTYEVSKRTNGKVTQAAVWRLENNDNERIDGIALARICRVLGIGTDEVLGTYDDNVESAAPAVDNSPE